jgi:hypothetical protein
MKAYISTKFQNVEEFNIIQNALQKNGIEITVDWTKHQYVKPFSKNQELCNKQSQEDIQGIKDADFFIFYFDGKNKGAGMFFELGYAFALTTFGKMRQIFCIGENIRDTSMFLGLEQLTIVESIEEIIEKIKDYE